MNGRIMRPDTRPHLIACPQPTQESACINGGIHTGAVHLQQSDNGLDVYGLGFSGSPLSQYLTHAELADAAFAPELFILVVTPIRLTQPHTTSSPTVS
jgi:hypothetical protein